MQDESKNSAIVEDDPTGSNLSAGDAQLSSGRCLAAPGVPARSQVKSSRRGNVRSLERGLALLELVNDAGGVLPSDSARILRLPRPTAHRLLETLQKLGYVRRSLSDNRFYVTNKAQRLSGGYDTDAQLGEVAGPVLAQSLKELVWPINITTHRAGMMVVQESTHSRSPLSVDRDMVGREVPMLRTASGRVYLAFCPQAERREILRLLRVRGDAADEPYLFPGAVEELLLQCRKKCYGARLNEEFLPKTSSVALPIMINGYARASISVHWPTAAIPAPKAVQQFVPQLAEVAEMLSRRLTAAQWFPHDAGSAEEPRC